MSRFSTVTIVLVAVASAVIATAVLLGRSESASSNVPTTTGTQSPAEGCLFENGWNVCDFGEADVKDVYLRYRGFLGEPISGFDARCQTFRFGRLCYTAGNASDWKVELANLGYQDMLAQGYTPQPGSSPDPALRDWLITQMEAGVDITRLVGRVISEPVCERASQGECRQWTDKGLFVFPRGASAERQIQRAPLGLHFSHPRTREAAPAIDLRRAALVLLALLGMAGLLFLTSRGGASGRSARTI
jgi:hypothetical protein